MIPTLISAVMLFGCFIDGLPYEYFKILRWVVFATCAYRSVLCLESKNQIWLWIFIIAGILFNPIIPIQLDRNIWLLIDGVLGLTMLFSILILQKGKRRHK